ncbi:MAG: glycosyltransferase [Actinomycetota bacterium]|nr:glycosyltransferase [Actinomycetota bacterium]
MTAVIPAFNASRYIDTAIQSVLSQTYRPIECIVVDDGSTDSTAAQVRRWGDRVRLIQQPNTGVSAARNAGAAHAQGHWLAFLDADDAWKPDKLARQVVAAGSGATDRVVVCSVELIDAGGDRHGQLGWQSPSNVLESLLMLNARTVSCSSTLFMTRERFASVQGFDGELSMSADWDLLVRLAMRFSVSVLNVPLAEYRVHEGNMSRDIALQERDMIHAVHKAFVDPALPKQFLPRRRRALANLHRMLAGSFYVTGARRRALYHVARSIGYSPSVLQYYLEYPARRLARGGSRRR